jgi:hypothetical protein
MEYLNVISLGAGKQSSYMLLRSLDGAYKHRPDFAIFSDPGCEPDYVYSYLDWLKKYVKDKYNFDIVIVSRGNLKKDVEDYVAGNRKRVAALPFFTEGGGITSRQCTSDYKIQPLRKHLQKVRNGKRVRLWIGISLDEIERIKTPSVKYIEHYYPLVENRVTIDQIIAYFENNGIREPGKSACLICPFHSFQYWSIFRRLFKSEFEAACKFDEAIRDYPGMNKKLYLTRYLKPLRDVDFSQHPSLFPELIEECEGLCGL